MWVYIWRRFFFAAFTVWLIVSLVFIAARLSPGDPVRALLGDYATDELLAQVRSWMGLDKPLLQQYVRFVKQVISGDLGYSYLRADRVGNAIRNQYSYTLQLTLGALLVEVLIGIPIGVFAAIQRNTWRDLAVMGTALVPLSAPNFWLGIVLLLLFSVKLRVFPLIGAGDPSSFTDLFSHLILPSVALGARSAAVLARFVRGAMLDILGEDFVRTARAKGLRERTVLIGHAFRNALIPITTIVGIDLTILLGGTMVIETVFSRPGIGQLLTMSVLSRDYAMLQGVIMVIAIAVVLVNTLVDITYAVIDPRIRYK